MWQEIKTWNMKRFFRNVIIIASFDFAASALASLDVISYDWKLQVMFIGGGAVGTVLSILDERALQKEINTLQRILDNLKTKHN